MPIDKLIHPCHLKPLAVYEYPYTREHFTGGFLFSEGLECSVAQCAGRLKDYCDGRCFLFIKCKESGDDGHNIH